MPLGVEGVVNGAADGGELLRCGLRLEPLHVPLALADGDAKFHRGYSRKGGQGMDAFQA